MKEDEPQILATTMIHNKEFHKKTNDKSVDPQNPRVTGRVGSLKNRIQQLIYYTKVKEDIYREDEQEQEL